MAIPGIFSTLVNAVTSQFLPQDNTDGENTSENPQNETGGTELSEETKAAVTAPETPEMPDPQKHPTAAQRWLNENTDAELDEDGIFGENSKKALEKYQKSIAPKPQLVDNVEQDTPENDEEGLEGDTELDAEDNVQQTGLVTIGPSGNATFDFTKPLDVENMTVEQKEALQREIGLTGSAVDGNFGTGSKAALNEYYVKNGIIGPNAKILDDVLTNELNIPYKSYAEGGSNAGQGMQLTIDGEKIAYNSSELSSGGDVDPELIQNLKETLPGIRDNVEGLRMIGGNDAYHLSDTYYDNRFNSYMNRPQKDKNGNITAKGQKRLDAIKKIVPGWDGKRKLTTDERKALKANKTLGWKSNHTDGKSADFAVTKPFPGRNKAARWAAYRNSPEAVAKVQATIQNLKDQGFAESPKGSGIYRKGTKKIINEYDHPSASANGPHFHMGPNDGAH